MAKKKPWYKPQFRNRKKKTVGQRTFVDVIYLEKEKNDEGVESLYATCTCGWRSNEEAKTILKVAMQAKEHASTGLCRLRQHDLNRIPEYEILGEIDVEDIPDAPADNLA